MNIVQAYTIYQEIKKADSVYPFKIGALQKYTANTPRYTVVVTENHLEYDEEGEYILSALNKKTGKKIYTNGLVAEFLLTRIRAQMNKTR